MPGYVPYRYTDDNLRHSYTSRTAESQMTHEDMRKTYFSRSRTFAADAKVWMDSWNKR